MSATSLLPTPALDFALKRLGPLQATPVVLAGLPGPAQALLAARLSLAGAELRSALSEGASYILGAGDEDLTGQLGATSRVASVVQTVPVLDLSESPLMRLAHDQIGIGQASVMALLDITNLQLAGRRVVVCGYGPTGASVAAHVSALGGRVCVVETDPILGLQAACAGYDVEGFARALPPAEVVLATDDGPELTFGQSAHLSTGTILCAAGARAAISPEIIASAHDRRPVRDHVEALDLPQAPEVKLIAQGHPLHLAEGQGLPAETADIVLALHVLGLAQLLSVPDATPGRLRLERLAEAGLAAHLVALRGGELEV